MKTIKGNLLNQKEGILLHQVNCRGVMGAGIAKQIRSLYPQHYIDYKRALAKEINSQQKLGDIVVTRVSPTLTIVGLFAQDGYGRNKQHTNYKALEQCLIKVAQLNVQPIYAPYKIGCGLGGGDWEIVQQLFKKQLPQTIFVKIG